MKNPLSLEAFADWCEKQPADKEYSYIDSENCAVTQYMRACGFPCAYSNRDKWYERRDNQTWYAHKAPERRMDILACELPHTFGALAKRLREAI